ncbi:MAG: hypothetical protein EAZ88_05865 [Oscillatoriales cyanobacterium]|nr:MAG: hypothetical protein EAZ88_05865 [Oscillatoriales cyanobacterium]TAG44598.1 MAG: hypothetical protein EAZ33_09985 [Oscillatoriales cyanobacterium]TAG56063.1 MAG: hypothetical protein EAZ28_21000 [Oscillatoriales cyanobacterium]TAG70982.1 MAG: hypothetical protein EAZ23_20465 [Oscillatoriales cyanobacterium]
MFENWLKKVKGFHHKALTQNQETVLTQPLAGPVSRDTFKNDRLRLQYLWLKRDWQYRILMLSWRP